MSPGTQTSLQDMDRGCVGWLDKQPPISTGSLASVDEKELVKSSWGLANIDNHFYRSSGQGGHGEGEQETRGGGSRKRVESKSEVTEGRSGSLHRTRRIFSRGLREITETRSLITKMSSLGSSLSISLLSLR
ncbi:hypothetical protein OPV22_031205 [Ensete ventricosum]|uniref:Uncharacterized protein n=1 Tax=Ensete ventricosum TaxID=4639 RepID=A0AAV8PVU5_ENSVE|nr:hypothetical protein OPV22_031205 [Ensete ventricosum]